MCTVTFIPVNDRVFITSNRDEKSTRLAALPPVPYQMQTGKILFPKDTDAGGTWFAVHENGNTVVFLNGGWKKHIPNPPYSKSRGLVLLDLIDTADPAAAFRDSSFNNIEPFTAVIFAEKKLFECRWDGINKSMKRLTEQEPHIWSSVTLYDPAIIARRRQWFVDWLRQHSRPSMEDVFSFHRFTGDGDRHNDLLMDRDGHVATVSISSLEIGPESATLAYLELPSAKIKKFELVFSKAMLYK